MRSGAPFYLKICAVLGLGVMLAVAGGCQSDQSGHELTATGMIEMTEISVSSKVAGRVITLSINEGETVKAGQLIAKLDHEELDAQIAAAEANLNVAQLKYEKTNAAAELAAQGDDASLKSAQIKVARDNLTIAKISLEDAERNLKRVEELYRQGVVSKTDYESAVSRRQNAQTQYQIMEANLTLANTAPNTDDLDLANRQAAALLKQAQTNLELLKVQLRNTQITTPIGGVFANKLVNAGELVSPGMAIGTVLDYTKPWVKIYILLKEVEKVALNQKAYVTLDAYPERKILGRVSYISQQAEFTPKNFQTKEERVKQVYAVKVDLENTDNILKAGIPVDVVVELEEQ